MAKRIKMTPEIEESIRKDFEEALKMTKVADGKLNFTKTLPTVDQKATVFFSPTAYLKMTKLVKDMQKEVGWHGTARRGDDETKDEYFVDDIIVYPQEVTGATVNTDQEKYEQWLIGLEDDQFNNLRFHGHSHVNMGVTPSGVDVTHQEKILEQLEDDMFYIFLIINKSGSVYCKVYDLAKNILFDTSDVTVSVDTMGIDLDAFMTEAKSLVKEKTYTAPYGSGYMPPTYKGGYDPIKDKAPTPSAPSTPVTPSAPKSINDAKKPKDKKKTKMPVPASAAAYDPYDGWGEEAYNSPFYACDGYGRAYHGYE